MRRILVTGSSGLVGQAMLEVDPTVTGVNHAAFDLRSYTSTAQLFEAYRPSHVIHLAARVGGVQANMNDPVNFFEDNILINTNVLHAAAAWKVEKLICFMSTCVFPDKCPLPLTPEKIHMGPPHPSNAAYAYSKRMLEVQCRAYNGKRKQGDTLFIPVIPCNIYGPHDNFDLTNGHVVPSLIHKFKLAKEGNNEVTIWGSGSPLREFIFSQDIARLCYQVLDVYDSGEPLIISTDTEYSIADLVHEVASAMDFTGQIKFDSTKPDGQFRKPSDNSRLKELFPAFKFTPLSEGINKTVDWFNGNWPNVRK